MAEKQATEAIAVTAASPVSQPQGRRPGAASSSRAGNRVLGSVALLVTLGAGAYLGYPILVTALTTVSTDDAYVNSHVTYVASRIPESVVAVKVDNDDFVKKGDLLVALDDAMSKIKVGQAKAALDLAESELERNSPRPRGDHLFGQGQPFQAVVGHDQHSRSDRWPPRCHRRIRTEESRRKTGQNRGRPLCESCQEQFRDPGAGRCPQDRLRPGESGHSRHPRAGEENPGGT